MSVSFSRSLSLSLSFSVSSFSDLSVCASHLIVFGCVILVIFGAYIGFFSIFYTHMPALQYVCNPVHNCWCCRWWRCIVYSMLGISTTRIANVYMWFLLFRVIFFLSSVFIPFLWISLSHTDCVFVGVAHVHIQSTYVSVLFVFTFVVKWTICVLKKVFIYRVFFQC